MNASAGSAAAKIGCVLGFFNAYREGKRVTKKVLQNWLRGRPEKWGAPILEPPVGDDDESRRNKFVEKYSRDAKPNQVVAILKAGNRLAFWRPLEAKATKAPIWSTSSAG